jgi:hypothetical protein
MDIALIFMVLGWCFPLVCLAIGIYVLSKVIEGGE